MLISTDLTKKLWAALKIPESDPPSSQITEYAAGFLDALKAAPVSNAPGTIVGATAAGGPLIGGAGAGGLIAVVPAKMIAKTCVGLHPTAVANLQRENTALIAYIAATAQVTFAPGSITGTSSATPSSPGVLVAGTGTGGRIVGLTGAGALAAVKAAYKDGGPEGEAFYSALVEYLMENATVAYATGSVVGVTPAVSGPLAAGAATGGVIS